MKTRLSVNRQLIYQIKTRVLLKRKFTIQHRSHSIVIIRQTEFLLSKLLNTSLVNFCTLDGRWANNEHGCLVFKKIKRQLFHRLLAVLGGMRHRFSTAVTWALITFQIITKKIHSSWNWQHVCCFTELWQCVTWATAVDDWKIQV
jgi:hypothetical protein